MKKILLILMTCALAMGLYAQPSGDAQSCPGLSTVRDYDNNVYSTVKIGTQCWMKQNLRTTHFANGGIIYPGNNSASTTSYYYYDKTNSEIPLSLRGYYYNWAAAMHGAAATNNVPSGVQGICPNGWHMPSYAEGWVLINYLRSQSYYYCGNSSNYISKALAYTSYWETSNTSCAAGNTQSANNTSGFSAVPAGDWVSYNGQGFSWEKYHSYFWTTRQWSDGGVYFFDINYNVNEYSSILHSGTSLDPDCGLPVRCVHTDPTVTTSSVSSSNVHPTWATCGGTVNYPYSDLTVTARGVCWSTSSNPTVSNSYVNYGTGTGSFSINITGLTPQTTYYVRAYATTSLGVVYGEQVSFTTPAFRNPTVITSSVTNISANSATGGGSVGDYYNDGFTVSARGVCWSTSSNPTISSSHTSNGTGTGSFSSSITGLTPNTTYYVRAYATTSNGTVYGSQESFRTICNTVNVSISGNTTIYEGQSATLTVSGSGAESYAWSNGSTGSSITVSPTSTTTYTVTGSNSCGNTGTASVTVTVNPVCRSCPEYDGYINGSSFVYFVSGSIEVEDGCRTYKIENVSSQYKYTFETGGSGSADFDTKLFLYNASCDDVAYNDDYSAYGRQSRIEYIPTEDGTYYLKVNGYNGAYGTFTLVTKRECVSPLTISGDTVIRSGKSTTLTATGMGPYRWSNGSTNNSITVTPDATTTYTVFAHNGCGDSVSTSVTVTVLPGCRSCPEYDATLYINNSGVWNYKSDSTEVAYGCRTYKIENVSNQYKYIFETGGEGSASFDTRLYLFDASCTQVAFNDDYYGYQSRIEYTPTEDGTYYIKVDGWSNKYGSFSLAARRIDVPIVSTNSVTNIGTTTATSGGNITEEGYSAVTARGVCWSTSHYPTIADEHTSDGTGTGAFTSNITGLTSGATYYVRAYATNSKGTAYGEEMSFVTPCPDNQCELTFILTDSYGDGWNGNAILVKDAETGVVLGTIANEELDGNYGCLDGSCAETQTVTYAVCDGRNINFEWAQGSYSDETSYTVYGVRGEEIFSGSGGFSEPVSYTVNCCDDIDLDESNNYTYTENFDGYTTSTTAATGVEPSCWSLVLEDVDMTDANRPQLYYKSSYAHSGSYSLLLNYRGVYAMPALSEESEVPINRVKLSMYLRQPKAYYQLQVGVWEEDGTFVPVATFNNSGTDLEYVECNFSSYRGGGSRIAFRNVLADGYSYNYSYNYIDDITLTENCDPITLPYTENFDGYTSFTTAATGVEPTCWSLVQEDVEMTSSNRPQLYYKSSYAHSGSYSLLLNYRGVYAMPALSEESETPLNQMKLSMYLRQPKAYYQLQVGVWEDGTFVPVATFNNSGTDMEYVECDFSSYRGAGRRIAFRNVLASGYSYNYSYNYIDDIALTDNCEPITLPYTENFDSYTTSTTSATGVEPTCWSLVQEDVEMTESNRPQLFYKISYAHSGSYTLFLNYRGVYAMPALSEESEIPLNRVKLSMYLRQPKAYYRLQVGVWEDDGTFVPVATFNNSGTDMEFVECNFSGYRGSGRRIAFRNVLASGYSYNYSYNYIDDITLTDNCEPITLPYAENFDGYTESTTAATGAEPECWELVREDVTMTDANRPQLCYNSNYAHSGSYSLLLNYRGVYAMPALSEESETPLNRVKLSMYLRQPKAYYRLQVGVWEDDGTFVPVKTFNNSGTGVTRVECDFSNYTGNGRRIAFRNVLASGYSYNYSYNYIDDITLTDICDITVPYAEDFDTYTASTTAATGEEPECWELVREDVSMTSSNRPQLYYNSSYAHSGSYSLLLNYRGVYAMPALAGTPLDQVSLSMYLRQPKAYYRLQVGVWEDDGTFVPVKTFNNSGTGVTQVSCDFSSYTGSGRRIAFRNVLASGYSYNYSYNYIDDINLSRTTGKSMEVTDANADDAGMLGADRDMFDVMVYPNPTKDVINVQGTMDNVQCTGIEVVDVYGKVVRVDVETCHGASLQTQINVSGLAAGMYFVRVTTDRGVVTKPFVKK